MPYSEKTPSAPEDTFTCADLYWRATCALLAKSTARILTLQNRAQQGQLAGFLAYGGNSASGTLAQVTREDDWRRPLQTMQGGNFTVSDDHYMGIGDYHPHSREKSPQERQSLLAAGIAPLHITISALGFVRHYDLFYPDQLRPRERLHATIYPVDPTELQYELPNDWPKEQPYLTEVSGGTRGGAIPFPDLHANLSRVYNTLGDVALKTE